MQDKSQIKEYVIKIYNSPAEVRRQPNISACLKKIKRFCRNAMTDEVPDVVGARWLSDNYYVVERETKALLKADKKDFPKTSRLYSYIEKLFFFTEYELTHDAASGFFEVFSRNDFLSDREIRCVQNVMKAVIIKRIAALCDELSQNAGFDVTAAEKSLTYEKIARNLITSLRKSSIIDFGAFVAGFSQTERMLRLDPAGIYPKCDKPTQRLYRRCLEKIARKKGKSEVETLSEILSLCSAQEDERRHIGFYLFEKPSSAPYIFTLLTLFAAFCAATFLLYRKMGFWLIPTVIFTLIPLFESADAVACRLCAAFKKADVIPKLKFDSTVGIPDDCRTLTVISSLLFGGEEDEKLFERLERFYLANRDKNLLFGVMGDLREAKSATCDADEKIVADAMRGIEKLNRKYGGGFYLFVRQRRYSQTQECHMGYERKRGAIIELARMLRGGKTSIEYTVGDTARLSDVKYVLTLDADTDVGLGQIFTLCGAMAHPLNRPKISQKDGRCFVESGFGILQPRMSYALVPAGKTPFCVLKSGAGGKEAYPSAAFDIYQSFFGTGMFCGKGIFDVDAFLKVVDGAFPDDSVLSHDILEGCLLRCGAVSDVVLTDSLPQNPMSYFKREHRWARGDVQALAFIGRRTHDADGRVSENPLSALSKYQLARNIFRMLSPVCAAATLFVSLLCGNEIAAIIGFSYILLPFVCDAVHTVVCGHFQQIYRKFAADVISGIWSTFLNLLYDISTLFHRAVINFDALVRTLWRMKVSHKKLLEWTTASEADKVKNAGMFSYFIYMKAVVAAGIFFCFASNGGFVRFCGVAFVLCPIVCCLLSRPIRITRALSERDAGIIKEYCRDMWKFFSREVTRTGNYLPPDNVQFSPVCSRAERCSPTNVGLYLLSVLAARDFGFIRTDELYERLKNTLDTLEKLEKWHGHLFNWYDNVTLETVGTKYVSTVDSGNFVTALTALEVGLDDYIPEDGRLTLLKNRIRKTVDKTDFRALYNSSRDLFYLGYNAETDTAGEGCYDLYMSESRTTGYFAVARGEVPKRHWAAIGRILVSRGFYIGAASWTGTAFEYFMPTLFLPVYRNSFSHETLNFAYNEQKKHYAEADGVKVWGTSECGFYDFDARMNYQYKAIGVPFLSLKHEQDEDKVISPYSSFLMLECNVGEVLENLENLKKLGMYSKYGFYEAVDFTPSRTEGGFARVESYMAHHVGMSIIAAANCVFDGVFRRRFMSDPRMACAAELLEEKIPTDANIFNDIDVGEIPEKRLKAPCCLKSDVICAARPRIALFCGYKSSLRVSDCGDVWFERREERRIRCIVNPPATLSDARPGVVCAVKINRNVYSPTREMCFDDARVNFEYNRDSASFNIIGDGRAVNVTYRLSARACVMYANIDVACREGDKIEYTLYLEPILNAYADYAVHPAFGALSFEAEYDAENGIVVFHRRSRKAGDELWLAAGLVDTKTDFTFETRADKLLCESDKICDIINSSRPLSCAVGSCVDPRLFMRVKSKIGGRRGKNTDKMCFMVLCAPNRQKAINAFLRARENFAAGREVGALAAANTKKALETSTENMDIADYLLLEKILRAVSFPQHGTIVAENAPRFERENLWSFSVSGDLPIITVALSSREQLKFCGRMIMLHRLCALKGVLYDLVFLMREPEEYTRPLYGGLSALTSRYGSDYLVGKKGGLFFVNADKATELFGACSAAWFDGEDSVERPAAALRLPQIRTLPDKTWRGEKYEAVLETYGGDFINHGFVIDKLNRKPALNYSYVLSDTAFGTVITHNSLGYTWFSNSHERRLTRFENSAYDSFLSETLYMVGDDGVYDLCRMAARVDFTLGGAAYYGRAEGVDYKIEVFIHAVLFAKCVRVTLSAAKKIFYVAHPAAEKCRFEKGEKSITFSAVFGRDRAILTMPKAAECRVCTSLFEAFGNREGVCDAAVIGSEGAISEFALFAANCDRLLEHTVNALENESFSSAKMKSREKVEKTMGNLLKTGVAGQNPLKIMSDFWLPYQAIFCRFFARGALYQSGGAYGFRDQLQDVGIFLKSNPKIARTHIIRCAAHQFEEGDVQHWWHNIVAHDGFNPGIRSRCSDDYLWLVYGVAKYVEHTDDVSLLKVKVRYLHDKPLNANEIERYSAPSVSDVSETVYDHCVRALELFEKRGLGAHGLPFIGSCDWNDGYSAVGEGGKGESVWLAMFARIVLEKFGALTAKLGGNPQKYFNLSDLLGKNVDEHAYNGKWFVRGFYDDGSPLGDETCDECKIDLLPQAFSAICDDVVARLRPTAHRTEKTRIESALDYAHKYLYDAENRILKLFAPPFDRTEKNPGYIKSYAAGLRENGGQYTHAAVWGAMGFLCAGQNERADEIINALCPALRARDKTLFEKYKAEPYVLCGDVYSNPSHEGRGGWSWYTGSAAWYYELLN